MGSLSVSKRLSLGFGLVLIMMSAMIMVALFNLDSIGTSNARIIEKDWVKAEAANEVRTLAQRSSTAAKEIKELIDDSVQRVNTGARLVDKAGATMEDIVTSIQRVTDLMRDISSATNKQSDEIGHVNEAVAQADAAAQQNATIVEETAAASASMQDQAVRLAETVAMFRLGDEKMAVQPRPVTLIKSEQAANEPKALLAPTRRNAPRLARA